MVPNYFIALKCMCKKIMEKFKHDETDTTTAMGKGMFPMDFG
jgi:hypothetical protein